MKNQSMTLHSTNRPFYIIRMCFILAALVLLCATCTQKEEGADASGTFEATETIVSAEATGTIEHFDVSEGQHLAAGQNVGHIDSIQLVLRKVQLEAQIGAVLSRRPDTKSQLATVREQLRVAERERDRLARLVEARAVARKLLEDAEGQVAVLTKQLDALNASLGISRQSLSQESVPLRVQIEQIDDQIARCNIINPVKGTVLTKYAEAHEITAVGKPLYRIARLDTMYLRAYITGAQFSTIKLGQRVDVIVDEGAKGLNEYSGTIEWISDKAEFTPKTIQTKDERATLVYAMKVRVANDSYLKLGMYGEVQF